MRRTALGTLIVLPLALAVSASAMEQRETMTTTMYSGTVSDLSPSRSTIIVDSPPQIVTHVYNDRTVRLNPWGDTITTETVRNQPFTTYYEKEVTRW